MNMGNSSSWNLKFLFLSQVCASKRIAEIKFSLKREVGRERLEVLQPEECRWYSGVSKDRRDHSEVSQNTFFPPVQSLKHRLVLTAVRLARSVSHLRLRACLLAGKDHLHPCGGAGERGRGVKLPWSSGIFFIEFFFSAFLETLVWVLLSSEPRF